MITRLHDWLWRMVGGFKSKYPKVTKTVSNLQNPPIAFACLALVFGLIFCMVTPPYFALDESVHFNHAYQVSRGQIQAKKLTYRYYGGLVPETVDDSVLQSLTFRSNQPNLRTTYADNFKDKAKLKDPKVPALSIFNSVAVYTPVPYIPQATGILIGRILHLQTVYLMYIGRIFNLLAWIVLIYFAIKLLPFGKWALVVIALLPTSLFQASSLSADATTTGLAFLTAALIFKLATEKKLLQTKQYVTICVVMLLLALTKQSYFCFVLLIFALPVSKFRSKLDYWKKTSGVIALSLIPALAWSWTVRKIDIMLPVIPDHPVISVAAQLKEMITKPYIFGFATWSSYLTGRADMTVNSFIGQFGRVYDLQLPLAIVVLAYFLIFIALMSDEKIRTFKNERRLKAVSAGVLLLTLMAITAILYLTFSTLGKHYVDGIQARYFIPLMILLIPLAKLRKSNLVCIQAKPILFLVASTALLIISTAMMMHRFYYAFF